jgi:hypothetical protein
VWRASHRACSPTMGHADPLVPLQQVCCVPQVRDLGGQSLQFLKSGCHTNWFITSARLRCGGEPMASHDLGQLRPIRRAASGS